MLSQVFGIQLDRISNEKQILYHSNKPKSFDTIWCHLWWLFHRSATFPSFNLNGLEIFRREFTFDFCIAFVFRLLFHVVNVFLISDVV